MYFPPKEKDQAKTFAAWVRVAFVVAFVLLWYNEHVKVNELSKQLDTKANIQVFVPPIAIPPPQVVINPPTTGPQPTLNPKKSSSLTGYLEVAKTDFPVPTLVDAGQSLPVNVGFIEKGGQPIHDMAFTAWSPTVDFNVNVDDKIEKEAETTVWKTFNEVLEKYKQKRKRENIKGKDFGGSGMAWTTAYSAPLTDAQAKGIMSGSTRLYVTAWAEWKDSEGSPGKLQICQWLQKPKDKDLTKKENVIWHLCQFAP